MVYETIICKMGVVHQSKNMPWTDSKTCLRYVQLKMALIENWYYIQCISNECDCVNCDEDGKWCGYKWSNIAVDKMYHFLGIILKMSLISSDVDGLILHWYPPTHAIVSFTWQFDIRDYPSWVKVYTSIALFRLKVG